MKHEQELPADVIAALEQGRLVEAIKRLRDARGALSLAECRAAIERQQALSRSKSPGIAVLDETTQRRETEALVRQVRSALGAAFKERRYADLWRMLREVSSGEVAGLKRALGQTDAAHAERYGRRPRPASKPAVDPRYQVVRKGDTRDTFLNLILFAGVGCALVYWLFFA